MNIWYIYIYICMYVCMYVYIYVGMCMYVCMYVFYHYCDVYVSFYYNYGWLRLDLILEFKCVNMSWWGDNDFWNFNKFLFNCFNIYQLN